MDEPEPEPVTTLADARAAFALSAVDLTPVPVEDPPDDYDGVLVRVG